MATQTRPMPAWLGHSAFIVLFALLVVVGLFNLGFSIAEGASGRSTVGAAAQLFLFVGLLVLVTRVRTANRARSTATK